MSVGGGLRLAPLSLRACLRLVACASLVRGGFIVSTVFWAFAPGAAGGALPRRLRSTFSCAPAAPCAGRALGGPLGLACALCPRAPVGRVWVSCALCALHVRGAITVFSLSGSIMTVIADPPRCVRITYRENLAPRAQGSGCRGLTLARSCFAPCTLSPAPVRMPSPLPCCLFVLICFPCFSWFACRRRALCPRKPPAQQQSNFNLYFLPLSVFGVYGGAPPCPPGCLWLVPSSALLAPRFLSLAVALRAPDLGALGAQSDTLMAILYPAFTNFGYAVS